MVKKQNIMFFFKHTTEHSTCCRILYENHFISLINIKMKKIITLVKWHHALNIKDSEFEIQHKIAKTRNKIRKSPILQNTRDFSH